MGKDLAVFLENKQLGLYVLCQTRYQVYPVYMMIPPTTVKYACSASCWATGIFFPGTRNGSVRIWVTMPE